MSRPRPVLPNSVYMVTRRCVNRKFLLKPSKQRNEAWLYCLAYAAERSGVRLLWSTVMSNHHHTGVHDPHGQISVFCRELHRLVAKHHNSELGRFEYFWSPGPPGRLRLLGVEDILDKLVYSIANPVKAHLVARARQWPGINTTAEQLCTTRTVERPTHYFRQDGCMPEVLELIFHKPPGFEESSIRAFRELVASRVNAIESAIASDRKRSGQGVLGRRAIQNQHHEESPSSYAEHFKLNPQIASRNKWRRVEALRHLKEFVKSYRAALAQWRRGIRDVVFPYGTNMMRVVHGVRCCTHPG